MQGEEVLTCRRQSVSILIGTSSAMARMLMVGLLTMGMQLVFARSKRKLQSWKMTRVAKLTRMRSDSE